jgi:UDP-GlcNAc:undecaprenyl-phosphate GlcNAc-1-phosphate transferase
MYHFIVFAFSCLFVYFFTFLVKRAAIKLNFIDKPEERKFHTTPTPLLGGISILVGMIITFLISAILGNPIMPDFNRQLFFFFLGTILISGLGIIDDIFGTSPYIKFTIQTAIALTFILGTGVTTVLGAWYISVPIFILWMVGLMNAMNFLDNMDGITAGIATILSLGYCALGILSSNHYLSFLAALFMGCSLGFLFHNFHPAKIFLGDAGSMLVGYSLSAFGIILLPALPNNFTRLLPVLMLSYAIFDISLVSFTRHRDGRYVLQGGKDHTTHRIDTAMGSVKITALTVYFVNIVLVLISVIVFQINNQFLTLIATIILAGLFLFFGEKLDNVPIIITQNQLKHKESNPSKP